MLKVLKLPGLVSYSDALALQIKLVKEKLLNRATEADYLILLEHEPCIALGRRSHSQFDDLRLRTDIPIFKSPRGGLATFHGPGQMTCYPILDLKRFQGQEQLSLECYVKDLTSVMTESIRKIYKIQTLLPYSSERVGLWLPQNKKIGFIGIQAQQWIVSHGFSINLTADSLKGFNEIDPCGLKEQDIIITCAEQESLNYKPKFDDVCEAVKKSFENKFN